VARPLTELTKGDKKNWEWNEKAGEAFEELKQ